MTAWSQSEAERTIEEVKRRSALDPSFRALALSDSLAALARVNPRPIPANSVRFVESSEIENTKDDPQTLVIILPPLESAIEELTEEELENVAGGGDQPPTPPVGIS